MKALGLVRSDFVLLRVPGIIAALNLLLAAGLYLMVDSMDQTASRALQVSRAEFQQITGQIDQLLQEEQTLDRYMSRYENLVNDGVVEDEDRLGLLDRVAQLRAHNHLYPIAVQMEEQIEVLLDYPPERADADHPVALRSSRIQLRLPLLHEEDLTRLIAGLMDSPGLYQTEQCTITQSASAAVSYRALGENLTADCAVLWYTFNLEPQPVEVYY